MSLTFTDSGDAELTATLHNRRAQLIDNVFQGSATLKAFRDFGGVEVTGEGGVGIVRPVIASKNSTADSFSGFDTFSISPQDNETSLNFPWASLWVHIAIAWDEATRNSGSAKLIDLVNMKMDTAEMSLTDEFNIQLTQAQPASGSKDLIGLAELLDPVPTANPARGTDVLGGIDQSAQAWVRNTTDDTGDAFALADLQAVYDNASDGMDPVNLILCSQGGYETYEQSQVDQIRYSSGPSVDAGASDLLYKKSPMRWDPMIPSSLGSAAETFYGINTKYHKICFHEMGQFAVQPFRFAMNGAYKVAQILVMCQMIHTNRRRGFFYSAS